MMKLPKHSAALITCALIALPASAAGVYKCPAADGKTEYRDTPCTAAGKKLETEFNSIDMRPNPEITKKVRDFEQAVEQRQQTEGRVRERRAIADERAAQAADSLYRECQGYRDTITRYTPRLNAWSEVAHESAKAEIQIARTRLQDLGCKP